MAIKKIIDQRARCIITIVGAWADNLRRAPTGVLPAGYTADFSINSFEWNISPNVTTKGMNQ